jgi:hypothetical protein
MAQTSKSGRRKIQYLGLTGNNTRTSSNTTHLKYEITIDVDCSKVVWIRALYPGSVHDKRIYIEGGLRNKITVGKKVITDRVYGNKAYPFCYPLHSIVGLFFVEPNNSVIQQEGTQLQADRLLYFIYQSLPIWLTAHLPQVEPCFVVASN